jgi:hypothetical protein
LPDTVAVPTDVPPLVQVLGALACGPNTVNVTVPPALPVAPDSAPLIKPVPMAIPVASVDGAPAVSAVLALATDVEVIPLPHVLLEAELLESPL